MDTFFHFSQTEKHFHSTVYFWIICHFHSIFTRRGKAKPPFYTVSPVCYGSVGGLMGAISVTLCTLALTPCPWVKSPLHHPELHLIGHIPLVVSHLFRCKNGHQSILIHPDNTAMLHFINKGHLTPPFQYISSHS